MSVHTRTGYIIAINNHLKFLSEDELKDAEQQIKRAHNVDEMKKIYFKFRDLNGTKTLVASTQAMTSEQIEEERGDPLAEHYIPKIQPHMRSVLSQKIAREKENIQLAKIKEINKEQLKKLKTDLESARSMYLDTIKKINF